MSSRRKPPERAAWNPDGRHAWLLDEDGEAVASLELSPWYRAHEREPVAAWVVSWVDTSASEPTLLRAPAEAPAKSGNGPEREAELVAAAATALGRGERPPPPRSPALSAPPTARERFRQVELLIDAWDSSNAELSRALGEEGPAAEFLRYLRLSDVLARAYTVDRTLNGMWQGLPIDLREDASAWADERARRAIAHNSAGLRRMGRTYDPRTDLVLATYFARQTDGKPYTHWTGHLLTGALQEGFFQGLRWVRGQMTYFGATSPMELWAYRDGAEPRWKWKDAEAISWEKGNKRERALYDWFIAGHDVTGYFSHLLDVFWEAKWSLFKLMRRAENRRAGSLR